MSPEHRPERQTPKEAPKEILRFQSGHRGALYHRGEEAFSAMLQAIEGAEHHVHLETYILRADATGRRVLDALRERARAGVTVRLIIDWMGCRRLDRSVLTGLLEAGGELVEFNPPSRWLWRFRPRQRDHRKMLIVDGLVGFLGGLNIGDEYAAKDAAGATWRDAHLRLEGPSLVECQALFLENWFRAGGGSFDWRSLVSGDAAVDGDWSVAILADGPMYRRRRLRSFFLDELRRAKSHVLLVSPYFAPGPRVLEGIADASERGVDVELMLAGHSDHPMLRRAARAFIPALLRRGVRVFEDPRRMMHAKLAVFDHAMAVVGTSNLDRQSLDHSCEVNAVIRSPDAADWIETHFGSDSQGSTPIDLEYLAARSFLDRWLDRGAAALARL